MRKVVKGVGFRIQKEKATSALQAAYAEKGAISEEWKKALQRCFGYADGVNHYFLGLLEAQDAIIENNERVKRKAQTYQSTVENIYWEAESLAGGMLELSTAATKSAVSGDYGSMDWASTVDCAYEATHAYSELIVDGELQEDKIREYSASEALSDAQIAALGMVFADLTTRSMGGDEEPLNTFLGLGYVESSRFGAMNFQGLWTVIATYSALPRLLLAAQSWSDDSGLPTGVNPNITNARDATGAALLPNATISCHGRDVRCNPCIRRQGPLSRSRSPRIPPPMWRMPRSPSASRSPALARCPTVLPQTRTTPPMTQRLRRMPPTWFPTWRTSTSRTPSKRA